MVVYTRVRACPCSRCRRQSDVLEALRFLLKGADLDADFVTSPVAALDRLQERPYELLLADLNYTRDTTSAGEGLELVSRAACSTRSCPWSS